MASIRNVFRLAEMARSRGEPTWAMLDWAAQQQGTFTIKDLYKVYTQAGGDIGETSFHTLVNKLIAKPWKDDQDKYGLSVVPAGHRVLQGTCPDGPPNQSFFCNAHDMAKFWTSNDDVSDPQTAISITVIEDLPHVVDSSKSIDEFLTPEEKQKWVALAARKATEQSELQRSYRQAQKYQGMSIRCVKDSQ